MSYARAMLYAAIIIVCAGIGFTPGTSWKVLVFIQLPLCFVAGHLVSKLGNAAIVNRWLPRIHEMIFELAVIVTLFVSRVYNNDALTIFGGAMLGVLTLAAAGRFKQGGENGQRDDGSSTPE